MLSRTRLPGVLKRLLHGMGDALFPATCLGCGRLFQHDTATASQWPHPAGFSAAMAPHFCLPCRDRWTAVASPLCSRCGLVFKSREGEDHLCGRCLDRPGAFTRARAAGIYDNTLKTAIHALKFKGKVSLAGPLGGLLFDTFRHYWTAGDIDVVAPVPLHRQRFRQRGFNQAYLLVRRWALPARDRRRSRPAGAHPGHGPSDRIGSAAAADQHPEGLFREPSRSKRRQAGAAGG